MKTPPTRAPCSTTTCWRRRGTARSSGAASARTTTTGCSRASARRSFPRRRTAGTWISASTGRSSTRALGWAWSARSRGSVASRTFARRSHFRGRCTSCGREGGMTEPQIFGTHEPQTLAQLRDVASRAERAALMADGHVGYVMPIGGVAAYHDRISVVGVGFDIACGNAAIRTDKALADLGDDAEAQRRTLTTLGDEIAQTVSFGIGRKNRADDAPVDHPLFEDPA